MKPREYVCAGGTNAAKVECAVLHLVAKGPTRMADILTGVRANKPEVSSAVRRLLAQRLLRHTLAGLEVAPWEGVIGAGV